tara:strand:+ start:2501 stop:3385 length:885 start_codon:yes stop_codon:yes gene_type:complete
MRKKIKFYIIGSDGLIGKEICKNLEKKKIRYFHSDKKFDITKKPFFNILSKKKPNILVNCSSHPGGLSFKEPILNTEVNYLANINIAKWCEENNCKFIFLSSSAVYGNRKKKIKIKEIDFTNPDTIYGVNKLATEKFLIKYSKYKKFNWLVIRLFATYGYGHRLNNFQGIVNVILNQVLKGKKTVTLKGSKKRTRSLIHVHDAAEIIVKLAISKHKNQIINIASKNFYSINQIIKTIEKIVKKKIKIKELRGTPGDPMHNIANISKILKYFDYKFRFNLLDGLVDTINKYRKIN